MNDFEKWSTRDKIIYIIVWFFWLFLSFGAGYIYRSCDNAPIIHHGCDTIVKRDTIVREIVSYSDDEAFDAGYEAGYDDADHDSRYEEYLERRERDEEARTQNWY